MTRKTIGLILFLYCACFLAVAQDSDQRKTVTATRVDSAPAFTGTLSDGLWQTAIPATLPFEISPGENTPAGQQTQVYVLYDADNLYVGIRCLDTNPGNIRANVSDRDRIFSDDFISIVLDTYNDFQRGYELVVNPYGIQGDLMMTPNGEDDSFDMIWESKGSLSRDGWTAEMVIPFKSIRFPDQKNQTWGFNIFRNIPRESRTQTSLVQYDRNKANTLSQGGILAGIHDINSGGAVEVLPYVLGQQAGSIADIGDPSSAFSNGKLQGRVGGGIKYAPNSAFALDMVVNPDFSQVESDAAQISVNETFALYYGERRPFFLESQELIQTPMYYSRSINNPLFAGRVVGKSGALSYLYLGASDRHSVFVIPGEDQSSTIATNLRSFANIGRLRYNFEDETYVGLMGFTRDFSDAHNYVAGFDWNYKFWTNWYFSGEGFLSNTHELNDSTLFTSSRMFGTSGHGAGLDGERYNGSGIHMVLSQFGRDYGFDFVYNDFSPTYQTYNGLFSSVDYRQFYLAQRLSFYWDDGIVERLNVLLGSEVRHNHQGILKELTLEPRINVTLKGQTQVQASYLVVNEEFFRSVRLRNINRMHFNMNSRAWDELSFGFYAQVGRFIYRSSTPEMGRGHNLGASITVRPTSSLKIDVSYDRARLSRVSTGELLFDGYVARTVGIYQFTPEMFIRGIVQYNSFGQTFNVYPLFSYKLNALTTFYAGLTNDYLDYGDPNGFRTTQRQYFVKLQYLFRS